jgi:hypothetical protein
MAYMRQVGDTTPEEALTYSYWATVLQLLKIGIAWEAILSFSEGEVALILGVQGAIDQKEADDQTRAMAKNSGGMPLSSMGM